MGSWTTKYALSERVKLNSVLREYAKSPDSNIIIMQRNPVQHAYVFRLNKNRSLTNYGFCRLERRKNISSRFGGTLIRYLFVTTQRGSSVFLLQWDISEVPCPDYERLEARIRELEARVAQLLGRLHALEARQAQDSTTSSQPLCRDNWVPKSERQKTGRSSGARRGHVGKTLKMAERVDEVIT